MVTFRIRGYDLIFLARSHFRKRFTELTNCFLAHGISGPATAKHQAIVAIGNAVKRLSLTIGFADTFVVIGAVLVVAAVTLLFAHILERGESWSPS